jgi:hypothetical protein
MSSLLYTFVDNVVVPYQTFLLSVGIDSAFKAALVGGVLTTGALWALKPEFAFDKQTGKPRPWTFLSDETVQVEPTNVPWYVVVGGVTHTLNLIV